MRSVVLPWNQPFAMGSEVCLWVGAVFLGKNAVFVLPGALVWKFLRGEVIESGGRGLADQGTLWAYYSFFL